MSESVRECPETPWDTWTPPAHLVCPKVCPVCPSVSGQCPRTYVRSVRSVRGHMSECPKVSGQGSGSLFVNARVHTRPLPHVSFRLSVSTFCSIVLASVCRCPVSAVLCGRVPVREAHSSVCRRVSSPPPSSNFLQTVCASSLV